MIQIDPLTAAALEKCKRLGLITVDPSKQLTPEEERAGRLLDPEYRELQREACRRWRRRNKDKVRADNARYRQARKETQALSAR